MKNFILTLFFFIVIFFIQFEYSYANTISNIEENRSQINIKKSKISQLIKKTIHKISSKVLKIKRTKNETNYSSFLSFALISLAIIFICFTGFWGGFSLISLILTIGSFIFGIIGLTNGKKKKIWAIIGLSISSLAFIGIVILIIFLSNRRMC